MAVTLNESALRLLLDSETGPVGIDLTRRADNILAAARQNVGQSFNIRSGNLFRSLHRTVTHDTLGLVAMIGVDPNIAPYAGYLENGTEPHQITGNPWLVSEPNNPDPLLSPQHSVNHPGNQPMPFIRPALEAGRL